MMAIDRPGGNVTTRRNNAERKSKLHQPRKDGFQEVGNGNDERCVCVEVRFELSFGERELCRRRMRRI